MTNGLPAGFVDSSDNKRVLCDVGGNQRDLARAKNLKKQSEKQKGKRDDGLTVEQRKQR